MKKLAKLAYKYTDKVLANIGKNGWIKVLLRSISNEAFDGTWIEYPFEWLVLDRGDAVGVLLHDVIRDEIVIVEQFRPAILNNIFEIPAGMLPEGEDPEKCAIREVWEEVKIKLKSVIHISTFFVSPGATTERVYLYYAQVNDLGIDGLINGLQDEGESVRKCVVSVSEVFEMMDRGLINDAKTLIALQWLRSQRVRV